MTEQEVKNLGFKLVEKYEHDQFHTSRFQQGILEVEFTYKADDLISLDLIIPELHYWPITLKEMKVLVPILCKTI